MELYERLCDLHDGEATGLHHHLRAPQGARRQQRGGKRGARSVRATMCLDSRVFAHAAVYEKVEEAQGQAG